MKLQKQLSRKRGDKQYCKWVLIIPPDIIEKADLKEGDFLEASVDSKLNIIISKNEK